MIFITRNEPFTCGHCGEVVERTDESCRNHCPSCLYSKHVDEFGPGDRESMCHGMMKPLHLKKEGEEFIIVHKCIKCGKEIPNKTASDDNLEILMDQKK